MVYAIRPYTPATKPDLLKTRTVVKLVVACSHDVRAGLLQSRWRLRTLVQNVPRGSEELIAGVDAEGCRVRSLGPLTQGCDARMAAVAVFVAVWRLQAQLLAALRRGRTPACMRARCRRSVRTYYE